MVDFTQNTDSDHHQVDISEHGSSTGVKNNNQKQKTESLSSRDYPPSSSSIDEKAKVVDDDEENEKKDGPPELKSKWDVIGHFKISWHNHKFWWCLLIWCLMTAYFLASVILKRKTQLSDILPFIFLYVFISFKMLFAFTGTKFLTKPIGRGYNSLSQNVIQRIPLWMKYAIGVVVLLVLILSISLSMSGDKSGSKAQRMQSLLGMVVITMMLVVTSKHPAHIQWRTVIVGYLLQFCLGCIVVKTKWGESFFSWLANMAKELLHFSSAGTAFLFDDKFITLKYFAVSVFPAIVFFAAFVQMVYYLGGMQWMLKRMGWVFQKLLDTSGAESIVAAASPFIGQSENVLLVKDYLEHMTNSEIHACMTAGFATISGSTLQGYILMGVDPKNIITACIMSIPCSLALSKIRYPEREESLTRGKIVDPPRRTNEANVLHALGNGAALGINLSLLIAANLIAVISMVALINFFLTWFGQFITIKDLTLQLILGYVLYPFTWLLGVPKQDVLQVSELLGLKFVVNEFYAYGILTKSVDNKPSIMDGLSERAKIIAQFSMCGFGNLGSIAQQIGALGSLAPSRKADFSRLALSACITGSVATAMTAAIISMVM